MDAAPPIDTPNSLSNHVGNLNYAGTLFILSAPSGAGKSSLVKALLAQDSDVEVSVSYTTRQPRPGEQEGLDYHFIDETTFKAWLNQNNFLEHAHVHGNWYGTSKPWVEAKMAQGKDVLLEIDWQGALQIMQQVPQAVSIFILPPSFRELERRLRDRATDAENTIIKRLAAATEEIAQAPRYNFIIVNDDFKIALEQLKSVVCAARCRYLQQRKRHHGKFLNFQLN
jgi:guanylate kinase